ncbi:MAG: TIGR01777 family oxidoreductase [Planctomycetota bacterium]|jgi:uncharacterized protein (TIGR01777 family)
MLARWHDRPGAFERLAPPWEAIELLDQQGEVPQDGSRVTLRTRVGPLWTKWIAEHEAYQPGRGFRDVQVKGPFARWIHTHSFEPDGENASILTDRVEYALPGGAIGHMLAGKLVREKLEKTFEHRHATTASDLAAHAGTAPMRIAVTGASGMVGSALVPFLTTGGHDVVAATRDGSSIDHADVVVHLAGENIAKGRWTRAKKRRIRDSRVDGTRAVAEKIASMERKPSVLVCASAIGYYGDAGHRELHEALDPGSGFLPEVCEAWERAADPARAAGVRVVHLRFGVILHPSDGALKRMLLPFRLGAGGPIGNGRQWMSWISLDDAVGAIHHCIRTNEVEGPVNAVAPHPVTNGGYAKALGRVLRRPAIAPLPAPAARLLFGEMARDLLLTSTRAVPHRLIATGYRFRDPELKAALRRMLGR